LIKNTVYKILKIWLWEGERSSFISNIFQSPSRGSFFFFFFQEFIFCGVCEIPH